MVAVHRPSRPAQGKRVGVGKAGKNAANLAATKIQAKLALGQAGVFDDEGRSRLTFKNLAEEWLTKYPLVNSISQTTLENYTSFTRKHLVPYFGTLPVTAITPETVEDFIAAKRKPGGSTRFQDKPLSESTLRTGLIALRLILGRGVKAKLLPGNPAVGVGRFPRNDEETVDPAALIEREERASAAS